MSVQETANTYALRLLSFAYAFREKDQTKAATTGIGTLQGFKEIFAIRKTAANQAICVGIMRQSGNEELAFMVDERDRCNQRSL